MKLEHVAIWTRNLEELRTFYETYFHAVANDKYVSDKGENGVFNSYFLSFDKGGTRLELMKLEAVPECPIQGELGTLGYAHIAFSVDTMREVDALFMRMVEDGIKVASNPRLTGDGYYEACVLDPDGNKVEITTLGEDNRRNA